MSNENPYIEFYSKQAGNGIAVYSGNRYHNGNGFFGKIFKHIQPALKYLTRHGLDAVQSMSRELLTGEKFSDAGIKTLLNTSQNIMRDADRKIEKIKYERLNKNQEGSGVKRSKKSKSSKKVYKRKKQNINQFF